MNGRLLVKIRSVKFVNIKKRIRQPSVRPELVEGSLSKDKMVLFDKLRANGARWYYEKP
jgi:hypothetical protein